MSARSQRLIPTLTGDIGSTNIINVIVKCKSAFILLGGIECNSPQHKDYQADY